MFGLSRRGADAIGLGFSIGRRAEWRLPVFFLGKRLKAEGKIASDLERERERERESIYVIPMIFSNLTEKKGAKVERGKIENGAGHIMGLDPIIINGSVIYCQNQQ